MVVIVVVVLVTIMVGMFGICDCGVMVKMTVMIVCSMAEVVMVTAIVAAVL